MKKAGASGGVDDLERGRRKCNPHRGELASAARWVISGRELEVQPRYHLRWVPGKLRRRAGDIFERERLNDNVRKNEGAFRAPLDDLSDRPIVGEVRVAGFFWAIEIVRDQASRERPSPQQARHLVQEFFPSRLRELGILMRANNRGDLIQQLCPPLIAGPKEIARINDILRTAITEAIPRLQRTPSAWPASWKGLALWAGATRRGACSGLDHESKAGPPGRWPG